MTLWYHTINRERSKVGSISSGLTPLESFIPFSAVRVLVAEGLKDVAFCLFVRGTFLQPSVPVWGCNVASIFFLCL